jgi:hypothetical protein
VNYALSRQLVFGAVAYARGLGFEPHPDFAQASGQLGEWDGVCDTTFVRDGVPVYIQGPHDDARKIMKTLRRKVGDGNFHVLAGFSSRGGAGPAGRQVRMSQARRECANLMGVDPA